MEALAHVRKPGTGTEQPSPRKGFEHLVGTLGIEHFLDKSVDYERLPQLIQELGAAQ